MSVPRTVPAAFVLLIVIWSTTPLTIKWSAAGSSFVFGAATRMSLGLCVAWVLIAVMRVPVRLDRRALLAYCAAALSLYGAMICVYWGAQRIPTGWVSVLFGLSPLITGVLSAIILRDRSLTGARLTGSLLGVAGLAVVFLNGHALGPAAVLGVAAIVVSSVLYSGAAVWMKLIDVDLPALATVGGGLALSVPLYVLSWWLLDGIVPQSLPLEAWLSIGYLAVFGSVLGFQMYFHVLKHLDAGRTSLISLVTPILALVIGHLFNGEPLTLRVWLGAALVLSALVLYELPMLRASWRQHKRLPVANTPAL